MAPAAQLLACGSGSASSAASAGTTPGTSDTASAVSAEYERAWRGAGVTPHQREASVYCRMVHPLWRQEPAAARSRRGGAQGACADLERGGGLDAAVEAARADHVHERAEQPVAPRDRPLRVLVHGEVRDGARGVLLGLCGRGRSDRCGDAQEAGGRRLQDRIDRLGHKKHGRFGLLPARRRTQAFHGGQ